VRRGGPLPRRTPLRNRPSRNEIPDEVRAGVIRRGGGRCERCGRIEWRGHLHHRKSRRYRDHRPCNLLYLCGRCHHDVHHDPLYRVGDRLAGWVLRGDQVPEDEPAWLAPRGWVLLGDDYSINDWSPA
jgi:5-methylcytosine-specific restriction endonuclease McrA